MLGSLLRVGLPLAKNLLSLLSENILLRLVVTAATSATGAAIQKAIYGSGVTTLITLNKEMKYIMKINISLDEWSLLTECVSETIEIDIKEQKSGFLGTLLCILYMLFCFLGNMLPFKEVIREGERTIKAGQVF